MDLLRDTGYNMRKDMKDLIRDGKKTSSSGYIRKGFSKYLSKQKKQDYEDDTVKADKRYITKKCPSGNINSLVRFLTSRIGKKWDEVYSEICKVNDNRSSSGRLLRKNLEWLVEAPGIKSINRWFPPKFFVYTDGTLQAAKQPLTWKEKAKAAKKIEPITSIPCTNGWRYELHDNIWYAEKTEEIIGKVPVRDDKEDYDKITGFKPGIVETKYHKIQCSKKELKIIRDYIKKRRNNG